MLDLIYEGLWGGLAARAFTVVLVVGFVISCILYLTNRRSSKEKAQWINSRASAILTSIGVFGTFFGVALGLGRFDPEQINESVPILLAGMKLAFWTSILGMFEALVLNILHFALSSSQKLETANEADAAEDIRSAIEAGNERLRELVKAIGGEGDTSLLTQIQKLRNDTNDSQKELIASARKIDSSLTSLNNAIGRPKETSLFYQLNQLRIESDRSSKALLDAFQTFADKMADNNMNALIKAMEKVMSDFNTAINDQLGQNFKELNATIGELIRLQQDYQSRQSELVKQFEIAQQGISASRDAIVDIAEDLRSVPETMKQISNVAASAQGEIERGKSLLEGFTALREKADEVFPTIQNAIKDLTKSLTDDINEITQQLTDDMDAAAKMITDSVEMQSEGIKKVEDHLDQTIKAQQNILRNGIDLLQQDFQKSSENIRKSMDRSFTTLDDQMVKTHTEVITDIGKNTARLYNKMREDHDRFMTGLSGLINELASKIQAIKAKLQ